MAMPVDYRALVEDFLTRIEATRRGYENATDDRARLMQGYAALQAVNRLILMAGGEPALLRPLGFIESAIFNASRGARPVALDHATEDGKKPSGTAPEVVQAIIAWSLELLIKVKLGTALASRRIADAARGVGLTDQH